MEWEWEGEPLWGDIDSYETFSSMLDRYRADEIESVRDEILELIKKQPALPIWLIGTRWNEEGISEHFTQWLIQQKEFFPTNQALLDLGLRTSMFKWRWDGVGLFAELGADVNQIVVPDRTLLDIACARCDFGYYCEDETELDQTVEFLTNAGAKHALELTWSEKLDCQSIFKHLPQYDDWAELVVTDLQKLDSATQEGYAKLFAACLNKSKLPSKKWWGGALQMFEEIGQADFLELLPSWLRAACETRKSMLYGFEGRGHVYRYSYMPRDVEVETRMISKKSATLLKSLLWLTDLMPVKERTLLLQDFTAAMFTTYPNFGIRSPTLATQSFSLLIQSKSGEKIGREMLAECKHKPSIKKMDAALAEL